MALERERIEQTAAEWVAREDRGLGAAESAELATWLNDSTANRLAYLRLKAGWERTQRLAALRGGEIAGVRGFWPRYRIAAAAVMAGAFLLAGVGYGLFQHWSQSQTYVSHTARQPILRLSDGTRIQLNINTEVKTRVTGAERSVTLEQGEAYFEVVHDDKRPFVVYAGNRRITDLGTKFSVRREGDDVKVIVTEGRVRVDVINAPVPAVPVIAVEGNMVLAKAEETLVTPKSQKEMDDDLSWRRGMLTFEQETLAAAAEEFNRYNARKIVVRGSAREIKIGGSFRADNIEVFAQLVKSALGLKVTQTPSEITISQ